MSSFASQSLNKFERDDLCLQGFPPLTYDNKPLKFSSSKRNTTEGILRSVSFSTDWKEKYVAVTFTSFFFLSEKCFFFARQSNLLIDLIANV